MHSYKGSLASLAAFLVSTDIQSFKPVMNFMDKEKIMITITIEIGPITITFSTTFNTGKHFNELSSP